MAKVTHKSEKADREVSPNAWIVWSKHLAENMDDGRVGQMRDKMENIWVALQNTGTPKWMVKTMENPVKIHDLRVPLFLETPIYRVEINMS